MPPKARCHCPAPPVRWAPAPANAAVYAGTIAAVPVPEREWNRRGSGGATRERRPAAANTAAADVRLTGAPRRVECRHRSASLIDPAVPGMGGSSVADSLGRAPGRARRRHRFGPRRLRRRPPGRSDGPARDGTGRRWCTSRSERASALAGVDRAAPIAEAIEDRELRSGSVKTLLTAARPACTNR